MFDQDVHVGRRFGAEAGVAEGDGVPRVIRANEIVRDGLSNVLRIRTREAPAIDGAQVSVLAEGESERSTRQSLQIRDRKSTRLNSSHVSISYAVFCLKKKKKKKQN